MVIPELRRRELPVPVRHGPKVFGNGYRRRAADVKQFDVNITITGGNITVTGSGTGIGSSYDGATCGTITILGGNVTATKGASAAYSIGGNPSYCGTVTIGGVEGAITDSPYTWPAP